MDEIDVDNLTSVQLALWVYLVKHKLTPSDAHSWAQDTTKITPVADLWRKQTKRTDSNEQIRNMSTSILCMAVKQGLIHQSPDGLQAWDQSISSCTSGKQLQESIRQGKVKKTQAATKKNRQEGNKQRKGKGPTKAANTKATPSMQAAKGQETSASTVKTAEGTMKNQQQQVDEAKGNGAETGTSSNAAASAPETNRQDVTTASAPSKNSGPNPNATEQSESTQDAPYVVLGEKSVKQGSGTAKPNTAGQASPSHITGANDTTTTTTPRTPQPTFEPQKSIPSLQAQPTTAASSSNSQSGEQGPEADMQRNLKEQGQLLMLLAAGKLDDAGNRRLQQLQAEFQAATKAGAMGPAPTGKKDGKP